MAGCAEQDNRVKIPDGTAAVCADISFFGENRSLGDPPGRLKEMGRFSTQSTSQKTYEVCFLPSLRVYGDDLSQKNGCGVFFDAAA